MKTSSNADLPSLLNNEFTDFRKERLAMSREHMKLHHRTMKTPKYVMLSNAYHEQFQMTATVICLAVSTKRYIFKTCSLLVASSLLPVNCNSFCYKMCTSIIASFSKHLYCCILLNLLSYIRLH